MAKAFTRGGYSFRPVVQHETLMTGWVVYRKGERGPYAERAFIDPASDGITHTVNMANVGHRTDARPSLKEACDLVMARLPMEGA